MNDPYTDIGICVQRLYKEYREHKKLIVAVDFDDTVFDFKNNNDTHDKMWKLLKRCQEQEFYIVCFTASSDERYPFITEHFQNFGINISSINKNPIPLKFGNHGKIYYNILLDDRAGLKCAMETLTAVLNLVEFEKSTENA